MPPSAAYFISKNVRTSLSLNERTIIDQPLAFQELTEAIQSMKKGKSLGTNGFKRHVFFRYFWDKLGPFLYRAFVLCCRENKTLLSHRGRGHHYDT